MNRGEDKALETKRQLHDKSLREIIVFQAFKCLCSRSSFFAEESWVSADRRGDPWKMLGSSQSNSIRGRNGLRKHKEEKSFAVYQQLGPSDITCQNQRKWANQICIKAFFVCLLRKLQFAFKLEVKKEYVFEKFWPWYFASLNCFQLLEKTRKENAWNDLRSLYIRRNYHRNAIFTSSCKTFDGPHPHALILNGEKEGTKVIHWSLYTTSLHVWPSLDVSLQVHPVLWLSRCALN